MDFEARRLTKALRGFDPSLFVRRNDEGTLCLWAERLLRPDEPEFVLMLTEDWTWKTPPREWGVEAIIAKLQDMKRGAPEILEELTAHNEKLRASRERGFKSENEAFFKDYRRQFAKATSDINTSTIEKVDLRREREKKYGHL